jgi:antitoxin FitA
MSISAWLPSVRRISLQSSELRGGIMPNLIVRNVPEDVIKALKKRAGRHGTSVEAEHRKILTQALLKTRKRSFAEVIAAMPNVGRDSDFERVQDQHSPDVLD